MDIFSKKSLKTIFSIPNRSRKNNKHKIHVKKTSSNRKSSSSSYGRKSRSSRSSSPLSDNFSPNNALNRSSKKFIRKTALPKKIKEIDKKLSVLEEQIKVFKKKPDAVKQNMDVIQVKNLDTGKVSQAFILSNAKDGKSQFLYLDTNKPVGKKSPL